MPRASVPDSATHTYAVSDRYGHPNYKPTWAETRPKRSDADDPKRADFIAQVVARIAAVGQ